MSLRPIPVLLYHRIEPVGALSSSAISTPLDVFRLHLDWLVDHGFRTLSLAELDARIDGAQPNRSNEIVITFDDGYDSLRHTVTPELEQRGLNGAAFLITDRVGQDDYITWDEAKRLSDAGTLEFHSHTHSHQRWELGSTTSATIGEELMVSRKLLSDNLGLPTRSFQYVAWPYGRTCDEWDAAAARLGVSTHFVVQRGAVTRPNRHGRLPRLMADGMPLKRFAPWVRALQTKPGAAASNRAFGTVRQMRKFGAYL